MRVAVTGADRPMGAALCRGLAANGRTVLAIGDSQAPGPALPDEAEYRGVDLRAPGRAREALRGADVIVHAQPHDPAPGDGDGAEQDLLDRLSRGTYVLVNAAREARIGRIVLVSDIGLLADYPEDSVIEAWWRPQPRADGRSLAPYLAELVCREIARIGAIEVRCLRMGALDAADGTSAADAVAAVEEALFSDIRGRGYGWQQDHVVSGGRFAPAGRR